jgi:hypothetical protein
MLVLTFIGGPLHADRRMAEMDTRTYRHTLIRENAIFRHVYDQLDINTSGELVYLYRGVRGVTVGAPAAPGF